MSYMCGLMKGENMALIKIQHYRYGDGLTLVAALEDYLISGSIAFALSLVVPILKCAAERSRKATITSFLLFVVSVELI